MKDSSQDSRMAAKAGESLGMRPRRTCGRSLGMGSDRCSIGMARPRNCSDVSIENRRATARRAPTKSYPVSGPQSVPLQGPQNQSPSLNIIGSSQTGQFGGFVLGLAPRISRSRSLSNSSANVLVLFVRRPDTQRFFGALARRHADELQFAINDRGRRGADRVPVRQLLAVRAEDIDLPVAEVVLDAQPLPHLLRRRTRPAGRRID